MFVVKFSCKWSILSKVQDCKLFYFLRKYALDYISLNDDQDYKTKPSPHESGAVS